MPSLRAALARAEVRQGMLVAALYAVAQKTAMGMFGPFFIDAGYDLAQLGILAGLGLSAAQLLLPATTVAPVAMVASAAVMAFGFVALYGQFMRWSDPRQGGVDFTIFQCMDAAVSMVAGMLAGVIAEHVGYAAFFGMSCALSLAMLPAIWSATSRATEMQHG
ncbi:hypothetical protein [Alloyangia pacifica]|uniref:hypothetical protein n=1 Tax=Alloyangia pacifica TaxID=311180 RepID=UPI001CD5725D|nr:hypothetical protein [Alloyangia pacifica]MCA0994974.1 hypothetical protein [Alloyangia pacifica]